MVALVVGENESAQQQPVPAGGPVVTAGGYGPVAVPAPAPVPVVTAAASAYSIAPAPQPNAAQPAQAVPVKSVRLCIVYIYIDLKTI